jgi:dihydrofolate reductase
MDHKVYLIVAADLKNGIGIKGKLPWQLPGDMKHFRYTTIKTENDQYRNMVLMGRVTWDSLPLNSRPLKARKNVVVTRNKDFKADKSVTVVHSIEQGLKEADDRVADIFVIGGAKIFEEFMKKHKVDGIYLTRVKKEFKCDVSFPKIPKGYKAEKLGEGKDGDVSYEFLLYTK